jgi:hypothetical protein
MLTASDFLKLPYTSDLTEGGIAYAVRSLPYTYDRMGGSMTSRLRHIVGGVAVELAFRRALGERAIPFDVQGATPFSEPDRYDVALGGHRCDVKTFIMSRRSQISATKRSPELVLQAPALIPSDQFASQKHSDQDIYLFAFLFALTTNSIEEVQKVMETGQPTFLVHPLPADWSRPAGWAPLKRLSLKSETAMPLNIEIGGQDAQRNFITEKLTLPPLTRVFAANDYYSLAYVQIDRLPTARLGVHSRAMGDVYLIQPHDWGNIWVYGMEIWLAGYVSHEEFRRKATPIFAGSRVFQYSKTQTKNLSLPVADLRPLSELFERVKEWDRAGKTW